MADGDRFGASLPSRAERASWKSPVERPRRYRIGSSASKLLVRPADFGRIAEVKRIRSAALLVPLALLERPWQSFASASWVAYVVIAYSALLGTPAHIAFYQGVRTVGPGRASVFMNLMPFLVLGLSWLLLGQAIRWYHLIGAIGVIAGVILTTRR